MSSYVQDRQRILVETSKSEFCKKCRRVSLKNIPCGVLNQDILELLKPYFYQQIHIDKNSQSCKAVLLDGECAARCIADLNGKFFRGQRLAVNLASCDFMLCITQLPLSYTHNQFLSLLAPFGTSERCFLVHSNVTGESKGYGCVEFTSKESSIKAKNHLNGATVNNHTLQVHWLDSIPSVYSGLYSKCLLVEDLPDFRDNTVLFQLFSQCAVPSFCQLANCSVNNFGIVEYQDATDAEETWRKLNGNPALGISKLKVSFCVPGPCGLVVLNALKASRDLKRANPTGGLLPTPVQSMDQSNGPSMLHHKKGVPSSVALTAIENGILNVNAAKDPEVHHLLTALQSRLAENNLPPSSVSTLHPTLWPQQQSHTPGLLNQMQATEHIPTHVMSLRSRSGSISSCDSGARVDDDVFEPTRRRSQEDQFESWSNTKENNMKFPQHNQRPDTRNLFDSSNVGVTSLQPPPSLHNNPLLFLREDSQRSESADSAYSGSQGSNTSENSFPLASHNNSERPAVNQHGCLLPTPHNTAPAAKHRPSGLLGDAPSHPGAFGHSKLPPGIQRFPGPIGQQYQQGLADVAKQQHHHGNSNPVSFSGSSGSSLFHRDASCVRRTVSNDNHSMSMETVSSLPRGCSSAFNNVVQPKSKEMRVGLIPRPEFSKSDCTVTKVPVTLFCGKPTTVRCKSDFSSLDRGAVISKQFVGGANGHETPKYRGHRCRTPNGVLSADSPTQLQLLGSSLMEGLLGESPRSSANWSMAGSGNCRLLRALNLMSPTDFPGSPQTPISVRKRVGNMLPSPEPSPEAGAYVGQHSQGLGGHYADSYGLVALIGAGLPQPPTNPSPFVQKRRRSNET